MELELREIIALGMPVQYDVWIEGSRPFVKLRSFSEGLKSADRMIKHLEDHGYKIVCESHSEGGENEKVQDDS